MSLVFTMSTEAPQEKNQCLITDTADPVVEEVVEVKKEVRRRTGGQVIKKYKSALGVNCVAYAKSKGNVPNGMETLSQKVSHIKSKKPKKGKIGVTAEGPVGHLVYVEEVKDGTVIISEGNYRHGYVTVREIPKEIIIGYF